MKNVAKTNVNNDFSVSICDDEELVDDELLHDFIRNKEDLYGKGMHFLNIFQLVLSISRMINIAFITFCPPREDEYDAKVSEL